MVGVLDEGRGPRTGVWRSDWTVVLEWGTRLAPDRQPARDDHVRGAGRSPPL